MTHPTLTGSAAGDFFHRLGLIEAQYLDVTALQGNPSGGTTNVLSAASTATRIASIQADFAAATADYDAAMAYQTAADAFQQSTEAFAQAVQVSVVQADLIYLANKDSSQPVLTYQAAVQYLINCMVADAATISQGTLPAVGAQTNAVGVTPTGNPTFVWSAKDAAGRALQYVYPETVSVLVTTDNQNGATKGQEPFTVIGQNVQADTLAWDWLLSNKYGSGATSSGSLIDPTVNNTGAATGNLLVNGAVLVATTSNQADNWTILTGSAGTTITVTAASGGYITGSGVIVMVSDGATLLAITQAFNTPSTQTVGAGGTPYALTPSAVNNLQIAFYIPFKQSTANPAAGVLEADLIDGTGGGATIITDDQSVQNKATVTLGGANLGTGWQILTLVARLPKLLPANTPYKIKIWQSTAVSNGCNISLSCMAAAVMTQLYVGGPYYAGFRGSTDVIASGQTVDSWTFAVTATIGKLQKAMWRWFNVPSIPMVAGQGVSNPGAVIPAVASGSATIPDSLVA